MIEFRPRIFAAGARAGVTARPYSFSAGPSTTAAAALEARGALAAELGAPLASLVFARQVHGSRVVRLPADDPGEADGMITETPGLYLCLAIADCCAVLVHDPLRGAVGAFHAGWRGARDRIVARGIEALAAAYGCRPRDLTVYLSPCASGERYVVGEDVAGLFPRSLRRRADGRTTLDIPAELCAQLGELGVPSGSIETSGVCTLADPRCHSHRRDGGGAGRMAAFIGLESGAVAPRALPRAV